MIISDVTTIVTASGMPTDRGNMISIETYDKENQKLRQWDDFRQEVADALYVIACRGKDCPRPNNDDELALWNLSEDARGLEYNPASICDLVHDLEEWEDVQGVDEIQDRFLTLLENHFGVSPRFFRRTAKPAIHETARSYKVPAEG